MSIKDNPVLMSGIQKAVDKTNSKWSKENLSSREALLLFMEELKSRPIIEIDRKIRDK